MEGEGLAHLLNETVSVVGLLKLRHRVVQDAFDNERIRTEPRKVSGCCTTEVVQGPISDAGELVELCFVLCPRMRALPTL